VSEQGEQGVRDWREALQGYRASKGWHDDPATDKQLAVLERRGWHPPLIVMKGEAAHVIGKPTPKQRRFLEERGLWQDDLTFAEARETLDMIARSEGWATGEGKPVEPDAEALARIGLVPFNDLQD
jgi:hypothetical protein